MLLKPFSFLKAPAGGPPPAGISLLNPVTARISSTTDNVTQYTSTAFTAAAGSNRLILCAVGGWVPGTSTDTTFASVLLGGQAFTQVPGINRNVTPANVGFALYYLLDANIPAGSQVLTTNFSFNSRSCTAILMQLGGVDQANPIPTIGALGEGNLLDQGGGETVSVTTQHADSWVVSAIAHQQGEASPTLDCTGLPTTVAATGVTGSSDSSGGMAYEAVATPGLRNHVWTSGLTTRNWAGAAIEIKKAA